MSTYPRSIAVKIKWTKKHIGDLEGAIRTFLDSAPYKVGANHDPDTRKLIYYISNVEQVPDEISQIAGDVIGNLISVLDHLAFAMFLKGGATGDGRSVYFPIARNAKSADEYETASRGKVKGLPASVVAAIKALEPYQGGKGHQLWALNELNNLSKHRTLIAVGSQYRCMDIGAHAMALMGKVMEEVIDGPMPDVQILIRPADTQCPLKVGDKLFIDAVDAEPNPKMKFTFEVALHEPKIVNAQPILETLNQSLGLVDNIVRLFLPYV